jgi:hypothetical protein
MRATPVIAMSLQPNSRTIAAGVVTLSFVCYAVSSLSRSSDDATGMST